jgi:MurNAc alpha-1-phosphate uridylyltransferase
MKIKTAFILCAGLGKRLSPLTLKVPKPLLKLNEITMLENCINLIVKLGIEKIFINTYHLGDQISDFIDNKNFPIDIQIVQEKKKILNTGGGILNMINHSKDEDSEFLIFNPDTLWNDEYVHEINKMVSYYFLNDLKNILLVVKRELSFDQNLKGDFEIKKKILKKKNLNNMIYIGCQILNKNLFKKYKLESFPISEILNELLKKDELNGFESLNRFYHLTNLETFKKLEGF